MRILVAEDEEDIKTTYYETLIDRGHEVIVTSDGEECIEVYRGKQLREEQQQRLQHYNDQRKATQSAAEAEASSPYFDVVILDYKMPNKDGVQVAKEILDINPNQRIIFASAYIKETIVLESIKQLKRVVELIQKPFSVSALVETVEDKEVYQGLNQLMKSIRDIKNLEPTSDQIKDLFEGLRKIQKQRY